MTSTTNPLFHLVTLFLRGTTTSRHGGLLRKLGHLFSQNLKRI